MQNAKLSIAPLSIQYAAPLVLRVPHPIGLIGARQAVALNSGKVEILALPLCTLQDDGVGSCPSALAAQSPVNSVGHSATAGDMPPAHDAKESASSHPLCIDGGLLSHPLLAKCLDLICSGKYLLGWSFCQGWAILLLQKSIPVHWVQQVHLWEPWPPEKAINAVSLHKVADPCGAIQTNDADLINFGIVEHFGPMPDWPSPVLVP
mmetsp:Transcript_22342/g.42763  ORF Transcript_22342/g.42763 Transcript_22342/m.42763 type:complete len:206 (-) Transcript_22342:820-1437(-)